MDIQTPSTRPLPDAAVSLDAPGSPRRSDARSLLLDAAERLFAQRGIEGVSLREIAAEAGQRNNSAVTYHFRGKLGLVDALIADRLIKVERVRQRLIEKAGDLSSCDAPTLLRLMWQPLVDLDNRQSGHAFIQFMLSYQVQNAGSGHPFLTDPAGYPASGRIMAELKARFDRVPAQQFHYRLTLLAMMFWAAVSWHDNVAISSNQHWSARFSLDEVIKLTIAGLSAPAECRIWVKRLT
jgi:TetR/AcrR family transcriptional regulator, regulator of cefoperazone and chloramphenicol sensitivity